MYLYSEDITGSSSDLKIKSFQEALARSMSRTSQTSTASELTEFTLALIKPDAVRDGHVEEIIAGLNENGKNNETL